MQEPIPALPANLPTDWQINQIVAPNGADVGLPEEYGYNYLMQMVNLAHTAINAMPGNLGGFELMQEDIPVSDRKPKTLYAQILQNYGGES